MNLLADGIEIVREVLSNREAIELLGKLPDVPQGKAGSRDLHSLSWMPEFATTSPLGQLALTTLGPGVRAVRILFFDKQEGSNWKLPFHQDLTIAVRDRRETPDFGPWSMKDGLVHVQPPGEVLEHMVAIRLHLDVCHAGNGALKVIPGSHASGRLSADEVDRRACQGKQVVIEASIGDVVMMRPLLLHASSPASEPSHRRVLHIEYANFELPNGIEWALGWPVSLPGCLSDSANTSVPRD